MIVVAWKWLAAPGDDRSPGTSLADESALEVGLRLADATGDAVTVVTVGPVGAERGLRAALAAGAQRAVRVDAPPSLASEAVAASIATAAPPATWIVCGDVSADRGSGSVPAFLAAELGVAQALGLVAVTVGTSLDAVRRLDGGRREVLHVAGPAVVSVEGGVAALRRASLPAELAARTGAIEVGPGPRGPLAEPAAVQPYRPRARVLPAPAGSVATRLRDLLGAEADAAATHEIVALEPDEAAERILTALRSR